MINLAMRSQGAIERGSLSSINTVTEGPLQAQTIQSLNTRRGRNALPPAGQMQASPAQQSSGHAQASPAQQSSGHTQASPAQQNPGHAQASPAQQNPGHAQASPAQAGSGHTQSACSQSAHTQAPPTPSQHAPMPSPRPMPPLRHTVQKGQKVALEGSAPFHTLKACLGWDTANAECDVDVSAFLLDGTGKVPGDDWFIFYGQTESPDHSTVFCPESAEDRESITIRLDKLNPAVKKIVFVLTIHEALERKLHFGMVRDAYIRILDGDSQEELTSFKMDEYYTNVISMMIGEVYQHNGIWKFNAVGSGVAKDLSGLCGLYGVQVDG